MSKGFQPAGVIWWMIIPGAIVFSGLMAHYASIIPFEQFGFIGGNLQHFHRHYHWLIVAAFWATIVAHIYESNLARKICQKLRIDSTSTTLWTIQTFILGYPSLKILRGYLRQRD